jgi:hypothetical protein
VAGQIRVSRRFVAGAAGLAGLSAWATAGCDASRTASRPPARNSSPAAASARASAAASADDRLRGRAIAEERRLLAAAAAAPGAEPFATIRALHREHLRVLTGQLPPTSAPTSSGAAGAPPVAATLAAAERAAADARRSDCTRASAGFAPLLASIAASADVASALLMPPVS